MDNNPPSNLSDRPTDRPRLILGDEVLERLQKSCVMVTFLAILELIKRNAVTFRQNANFAELEIEKTENFNNAHDFHSEFGS